MKHGRFLLLLFLWAAPAFGQGKLWEFDGQAFDDRLGQSAANVGDINGDGLSDFAVGAHQADAGGMFNAGAVYLLNGATGTLLWQASGTAERQLLGWSLARVGDVDGDNTPDVGACGLNDAFILSGQNGFPVFHQHFDGQITGLSITGGFDVNGDGRMDWAVGEPSATIAAYGKVHIYSGGGQLYELQGEAPGDGFGKAVIFAGGNLIVSAPAAKNVFGELTGKVYVYDLATGQLLETQEGTVGLNNFGWVLLGMPNGNYVVGARRQDDGVGAAFVYGGGGLLFSFAGVYRPQNFGYSLATADANGDGVPDLLAGGLDSVYVYSGAGGTLLYAFACPFPTEAYGFVLAGNGNHFFCANQYADPNGAYDAGSSGLFDFTGLTTPLLQPALQTTTKGRKRR